ncbi:hypothetical protein DPMN_101250 [Dreissena polymorpha]|uniref:Uncharacterized protein n=1 Tax=Dreissena polymorpha TaxID=45954 RepID=A0A9D4LH68_DREPO|nr:hypothetical protein DPMN_101250 [Dreissena polymorpha]
MYYFFRFPKSSELAGVSCVTVCTCAFHIPSLLYYCRTTDSPPSTLHLHPVSPELNALHPVSPELNVRLKNEHTAFAGDWLLRTFL